jgi:hypothetical protein
VVRYLISEKPLYPVLQKDSLFTSRCSRERGVSGGGTSAPRSWNGHAGEVDGIGSTTQGDLRCVCEPSSGCSLTVYH